MSHQGPEEELFDTEIAKYDDVKSRVEEHAKKSKDVVDSLKCTGDKFKKVWCVVGGWPGSGVEQLRS